MKKIVLTILLSLFCAVLSITGATLSRADVFAETPQNEGVETNVENQAKNGLLLPESYPQYLSLTTPTDVAVCESHTAIADEKSIFIYYQAHDVYLRYTHTQQISQIQFDQADHLYFSDATANLYVLSLRAFYEDRTYKAELQSPTCSSFLLVKDVLYYTIVTQGKTTIYQLSTAHLQTALTKRTLLVEGLPSETPLAFFNEELYYFDHKNLYKALSNSDNDFVAVFNHKLKSMSVSENFFACVTDDNAFYVYGLHDIFKEKDVTKVTPYAVDETGYVSLDLYNENVYAVQNNRIREYSFTKNSFTEFEISSSSPSPHRLDSATQLCLADKTLYIAGANNFRISVYDTATKTFLTPVATQLSASHIAVTNDTLLVTSSTQACLYSLAENNYGALLQTYDGFDSQIVGVEGIYGKYYIATESDFFYHVEKTDEGWVRSGIKHILTHSTKALTADVSGNLYIVCNDDVLQFTEEQFLSSSHQGKKVCDNLPQQTLDIFVDFAGNVYAYTQTELFVYKADVWEKIEKDEIWVYRETATPPTVTSVCISLEENIAYTLYDGNYIVTSNRLFLPTLKTIAVEDVDESVFAKESVQTINVMETQENALFIEFDLASLPNAEYFPYRSYYRESGKITAIQIGETTDYHLLAVFDDGAKIYRTYLVYKQSCTALPENEYCTVYDTAQQKTGYLTNDVQLYKYPYFTDLLTARKLTKNAKVTLLGEIKAQYDYYKIEYVDGENVYIGYVPKTFVVLFNPQIPITNHFTHGETEVDEDGVRRFIVITLGFLAVCVLTDYLILKKPKDDNEE